MPTTIGSLLVFVAALTPGFVFLMRTETRLPGRRYTPVRETALIVSASLAAYGVVLFFFWIARGALPTHTPDVGLFILDPHAYFQDHYGEVTLWAVGLVATAVGLASVAAVPPRWSMKPISWLRIWPGPALQSYIENRHRRGPIAPESGWGVAFHRHPDQLVYVGLRLKDGTYLDGPLGMFSSQIEENDNRSIQLVRPVRIRTSSTDKLVEWAVDAVIVAASQIKTISVNYIPKDWVAAGSTPNRGVDDGEDGVYRP